MCGSDQRIRLSALGLLKGSGLECEDVRYDAHGSGLQLLDKALIPGSRL